MFAERIIENWKRFWLGLALLGTIQLLFLSCKKEGCTDQVANNYDSKAKVDDTSCEYPVNLLFWLSRATRDSLTIEYPLLIYVGGKMAGGLWDYQALDEEPVDCVENESLLLKSETIYDKNAEVVINVVDKNGLKLVSDSILFVSKYQCLRIKL